MFQDANGNNYAVKDTAKGVYDSIIKVTDRFNRDVVARYEIVTLGTFNFNWDGKGKVYLMSNPTDNPFSNLIWADNILKATTNK